MSQGPRLVVRSFLPVVLLPCLFTAGCHDPVRTTWYQGEPFVTFTAQLQKAPPGLMAGQRLLPWLSELNGNGSFANGEHRFVPAAFPHRFTLTLSHRPQMPQADSLRPVPTVAGAPTTISVMALEVRSDDVWSTPVATSASLSHWIVYTTTAADILPFGSGGPSVHINEGFNIIARTCAPGSLNRLDNLPLGTVIDVVPFTEESSEAAYRVRCGLPAQGSDGRPVFLQAEDEGPVADGGAQD